MLYTFLLLYIILINDFLFKKYTYYSNLNLKNFKFCYLIKKENLKNESK
jgi:hypothetical protein